MSFMTLSLPTDIPWKRLAISPDMYAQSSQPLPLKWHSSLAVFSYDPPPETITEPTNPDELTTFLKVVATITGFQPEGNDIDEHALTRSFRWTLIKNYDQLTNHYYPAYSALLQVAVFPTGRPPGGGEWVVSQYPYLTDFEPKKRELIELVTETGEALTQSGTTVNVRKGTTSAESTELNTVNRSGTSFGVQASQGSDTGESKTNQQVNYSASNMAEASAKNAVGTQSVNLTTTDASREKRELYSNTTSLSQLYQLLDSYHAGTNRAIFFLNARPHLVDSNLTFVNGPRKIEGIQEFFLVVRRPKAMEGICVTAVLETAHLHLSDEQVTKGDTTYSQGQDSQTFTDGTSTGTFSTGEKASDQTWQKFVPNGTVLDISRGGGTHTYTWDGGGATVALPAGISIQDDFTVAPGEENACLPTFTAFADHVDIKSHIVAGNFGRSASRRLTVTLYYRSEQPATTPQTETIHHADLYITARQVSSCSDRRWGSLASSVVYEKALPSQTANLLQAAQQGGREGAIAANAVGRQVDREVVASFRANQRYEPGEVDFIHTDFALRELLNGLDSTSIAQLTRSLHEVAPAHLQEQIRHKAPGLTVGQALQQPPEELAATIESSPLEARRLLTHALGIRMVSPASAPGSVRRLHPGDRGKVSHGFTVGPHDNPGSSSSSQT